MPVYSRFALKTFRIFVMFVPLLVLSAYSSAQTETDPHRPACASAVCQKTRSYLMAHYCGKSPSGNGPEDGCEIQPPKKPQAGVEVVATYHCEWSAAKQNSRCKQNGQPPAFVRSILLQELRRLGLPTNAKGETQFYVLKSLASGWLVAGAEYSHAVGENIELCGVIVIIDENSHVTILRKSPFQRTDVDVPKVTEWYPLDLADVDGDGHVDIIIEGDAYEDYWLEVVSLQNGSPQTIFSGLGYYL